MVVFLYHAGTTIIRMGLRDRKLPEMKLFFVKARGVGDVLWRHGSDPASQVENIKIAKVW